MNPGDMRLHWDDAAGTHLYETFSCVHDALERAGVVYAKNEGTLTRLENWMGEDACQPDQLLPVAKIRAQIHAKNSENEAMEDNPIYGTF